MASKSPRPDPRNGLNESSPRQELRHQAHPFSAPVGLPNFNSSDGIPSRFFPLGQSPSGLIQFAAPGDFLNSHLCTADWATNITKLPALPTEVIYPIGLEQNQRQGQSQGTKNGQTIEIDYFKSIAFPCAYFGDRLEQRLLVDLLPEAGQQALFEELTLCGFRRNGSNLYRPSCGHCSQCTSVRVPIKNYTPNRTQRKIINRNSDIHVSLTPNIATDEHFQLFKNYQLSRHAGGSMCDMLRQDYQMMVEDSPIKTRLYEMRYNNGEIAAVCIIDYLSNALSAVYSFFDTHENGRSLGTFTILSLMNYARSQSMDYLYLGYWIEDSPKMNYKSRFSPIEAYGVQGWSQLSE